VIWGDFRLVARMKLHGRTSLGWYQTSPTSWSGYENDGQMCRRAAVVEDRSGWAWSCYRGGVELARGHVPKDRRRLAELAELAEQPAAQVVAAILYADETWRSTGPGGTT